MLDAIVEELERILIETNKVKQSLNTICELSWDCLCPSGKNGTGSFRPECSTRDTRIELSSSVTANTIEHSPLEDVLHNVSDLIAYGKHIRKSACLENNGKDTKSQTVKRTIFKSDKSKQSVDTNSRKLTKVDSKCKIKTKPTMKKTIYTQTNQEIAATVKPESEEHLTKKDYVDGRNDQKVAIQSPFPIRPQTSNKYHHSCSVNLAETAKSINIPADLVSLLKMYHQYENIKIERHQKMNQFSEKFYNHVKSRLENDLKHHLEQEERYVKYLDVADSMYKSQEDNNLLGGLHNCQIQYKTEEQLKAFEDRYHRLMELEFQRRLMNVVSTNTT